MKLDSLEATKQFAKQLADTLPRGALVLLNGPLGAGKTTLVKYIAFALGFEGEVTSPTYTLIHEYPTITGSIIHIDAYRLEDQTALYGLGLEDYLDDARIVLVEWGDPDIFPDALLIKIEIDGDARIAQIEPAG